MSEKITLAIADDHPMIINGVKSMILHYPEIALTGCYINGKSLLQGLEQDEPNVLLLDIQMPDITGDELCPVILRKYPDIKILVMTNFDSALYANNMFKRGSHGYILKSADGSELMNAIKKVYNGEEYIGDDMKEKIRQMKVMERNVSFSKSTLTPRELAILQLLVNGLTAPQIAESIFLSLRTVINYRTSIMRKLECNNIAMLVKKALQTGLAK